ncbi:hypothetical protein [Streptomyces sp. KAU_LT]|uniref:hypothetical protein n=1 Tax=Streptomyces sp. KAU_LT TaxID=3046669 RepID=UPI0024B7B7F2|nr:hypothetical protein [Streptomyces sp. KAU_LT]MDI9836240.1 hypothetical protein [Streptomyces sp. KAU_LT]
MGALKEDRRAQEWLALSLNVLTLDDVWTQHLATQDPYADMRELARLGDTLRDQWLSLTDDKRLDFLREYAATQVERVPPLFREEDPFGGSTPTPKQALTRVRRNIASLAALRDGETERLRDKTELLDSGVWPEGDLSHEARCVLLATSILIAFLIGNMLAAAALGTWFMGSQCPNTLLGSPSGDE